MIAISTATTTSYRPLTATRISTPHLQHHPPPNDIDAIAPSITTPGDDGRADERHHFDNIANIMVSKAGRGGATRTPTASSSQQPSGPQRSWREKKPVRPDGSLGVMERLLTDWVVRGEFFGTKGSGPLHAEEST